MSNNNSNKREKETQLIGDFIFKDANGQSLEMVISEKQKKKIYIKGGFNLVYSNALYTMSHSDYKEKFKAISNEVVTVLFAMLSSTDYGGWITVTQKELANHTGIKVSNVNRSLGKLKKAEIVYEDIRDNRFKQLRFNPYFFFKGENADCLEARRHFLLQKGVKWFDIRDYMLQADYFAGDLDIIFQTVNSDEYKQYALNKVSGGEDFDLSEFE